jgi:hypothetical protein
MMRTSENFEMTLVLSPEELGELSIGLFACC